MKKPFVAEWGVDENGKGWVSDRLAKELESTPQRGVMITSDDVGAGRRFATNEDAAAFVVEFVEDALLNDRG